MKQTKFLISALLLFFLSSNAFCFVNREAIIDLKPVRERVKKLLEEKQVQPDEILVLFDWDKVISLKDSEQAVGSTPFEFRDKDTINLFKFLREQKIPILIWTARVQGWPTDMSFWTESPTTIHGLEVKNRKIAQEIVTESETSLNLFLDEMTDENLKLQLNRADLSPIKEQFQNSMFIYQDASGNSYFATVRTSIGFVGQKKEYGLDALLESGLLKKTPKVILFIDDKKEKVDQMDERFENRGDLIFYLYHYPFH